MFRISIVAIVFAVAAPAFAGSFEDEMDKLGQAADRKKAEDRADYEISRRRLDAESAAVEARQNSERQAEAIDRLNETIEHQNVILCCPRY